MQLSSDSIKYRENFKIEDLVIRWHGVYGLEDVKEPKGKPKFTESINKFDSYESTLSSSSVHSIKDETFLRVINRDFTLTKPNKKFASLAEKEEQKVVEPVAPSTEVHTTNVTVYRKKSVEIVTAPRKSFKQILSRMRTLSTSENDMSSFHSSDLGYHDLSLINRNSDIVSTLNEGDDTFEVTIPYRSTYVSRKLKKLVPDMTECISAEGLVGFFVKEYYLKYPLKSETELFYKKMYEAVIKGDRVIYNLLRKHLNMLPKDLITLINNEKKAKTANNVSVLKDDANDRDLFFYTSLSSHFSNIMEEVAEDIIDLSYFFYPLFRITFENVKHNDILIKIDDEKVLKKRISELNAEIRADMDTPGSLIRFKVMEFVCSGELNYPLSVVMSNSCGSWLNNLLKSLFSPFSSVREESCLALAYVVTRPSLSNELLRSKQYDVAYDMIVVLIRAIEQFPENISSLYCLIGFVMQMASSAEIINYIVEVGPTLTNEFMAKNWPKLLYYALKYWPKDFMREKPGLLRKLIASFQYIILLKTAKKPAKMALNFLCRKFFMYTDILTVWYDIDLSHAEE